MLKTTKNLLLSCFILASGLVLLSPTPASAAACQPANNFFVPRWFDDLCSKTDPKKIASPNEFKNGKTAQATGSAIGTWVLIIVMNIVKTLLTIVGYVAVAFVIWGGFKYMTQGDNASGTAGARKTIQNAVIGLVISIMSVAIINFITSAIVA